MNILQALWICSVISLLTLGLVHVPVFSRFFRALPMHPAVP